MADYLLIDAYNVIHSWRNVFDVDKEPLDEIRTRFLDIIANYQGYVKEKIIVVFDAHLVKNSNQKHIKHANIQVVFTKERETADHYIERFVHKMSINNRVSVVTSDFLEQIIVFSGGGSRITPNELYNEINQKNRQNIRDVITKNIPNSRNTLSSNIDDEVLKKLDLLRKNIKD